jgi:hydroxypyruvate isomerase
MFPYDETVSDLQARVSQTGVKGAGFNLPAGVWAQGERGIAIFFDRVDEFRRGLDQAMAYARAIDCGHPTCLSNGRGRP